MRDRTYYRQLIDDELIEIGRDSKHELCIALAERLEDAIALDAQLADQQETIDERRLLTSSSRLEISSLMSLISSSRLEISSLMSLISSLEDEISALVKQINEGQPK